MSEHNTYRHFALRAAKDLAYGDEVIAKIKAAKKDSEIERIMIAARKEQARKEKERGVK